MDRLFDELEILDPDSIKDYEDYLKRYANVLHQNHYLILSAKHSLCQLMGRSDGFIINELDLSQLQRKEEYCRDLLNVVNVLEPGASRLRGIICYEVTFSLQFKLTLFDFFFNHEDARSNDGENNQGIRKSQHQQQSITMSPEGGV